MVDYPHKITVPQRPPYLVSRPRLLDLVGGAANQRVLTLTTPAGYGKTTLLVDYATSTSVPVCWYSLDRFDTDPWTFLTYLAASVTQQFPNALPATTALLEGRSRSPFATFSASLVRELATIESEWVLILDDWHLVDEVADCAELIERILLHCPRCRVILAARTFATIHDLMLFAARRQMSGLDEEHLRFTADELLPILTAATSVQATTEQAQRWVDQTNGWITGILLMNEASGALPPATERFDARAERRIYRFLAEQVFERQRPDIRAFLLDAALLEEVEAEACNALRRRSDSAVLLDEVMRAHLFVNEIKARIATFHPMFREFLLEHYRTVAPEQFRAIAQRMADLHLARDQWPAAFDMYMAANDRASAQRVVAIGGERMFLAGRLETLERWFAALWLDDLGATLLCLKARVLLDRGEQHKAQVLANLATARATEDERPNVVLVQAQIARVIGNYEGALALAQPTLGSWTTPAQHAAALRTIAICHQRLGHISLAVKELNQALALERERGDQFGVAQLHHDLGFCHEELGLLEAAEHYYSEAESYWAPSGNLGMLAMSSNSKGVVQHLGGRYTEARTTLTAAVAQAEAAAVPQYQATVLTSLGDLYSDLELWDQARDAYFKARQLGGTGYLMRYLDLAELQLLIRQRQYDAAARALRSLPAATVAQSRGVVVSIKGWIACNEGDHFAATEAIDGAIALLSEHGTPMDQARAWLLKAEIVARAAPTDLAELVATLDRAVRIADGMGHDAFLVSMALHLPAMMGRAATAGWSRTAEWTERHRDMRRASRNLGPGDPRPLIAVRALGSDQIFLNGAEVQIGWSKAREVLCYLLQHPQGGTPDALHTAIWPEESREKSRTVKDAIYALRSALPRELIVFHGRQFYRLNPEVAQIEYDVATFNALLDRAEDDPQARLAALELYGGAFLPTSDSEWSQNVRTQLEARYLQALHQAAEQREHHGSHAESVMLYQRILTFDSFDEAAHAGIMRCYLALGNRAAAVEQYHALRRYLHDELGLDLDQSSEVEQLYTRILDLV